MKAETTHRLSSETPSSARSSLAFERHRPLLQPLDLLGLYIERLRARGLEDLCADEAQHGALVERPDDFASRLRFREPARRTGMIQSGRISR